MGLMEFIMMKNLFGNTGASGNGAQPSVVGASWHKGKEYESLGTAYKISDLTPTIDDLQNNYTMFGGSPQVVTGLSLLQDGPFIYVNVQDSEENPIIVFQIITEDIEFEGIAVQKGIYFSPSVFESLVGTIEYASLCWEPTS